MYKPHLGLQCFAVCYSVLQCVSVCCCSANGALMGTPGVAVCCSVLQRVSVCCSVNGALSGAHGVAVCCSVLQCVLQCAAVCCRSNGALPGTPDVAMCCSVFSMLQCVAVCCIVLHCVAVCCSVLQCQWRLIRRLELHVLWCVAVCRSVFAACCSANVVLPGVLGASFPICQSLAMCCSVFIMLQCVAVCCIMLQFVAVCCSVNGALSDAWGCTCCVSQCVCSVLHCQCRLTRRAWGFVSHMPKSVPKIVTFLPLLAARFVGFTTFSVGTWYMKDLSSSNLSRSGLQRL